MDTSKYLKRIKYPDRVSVDEHTLNNLHLQHLMQVPFENLDVHFHRMFDLDPENIYRKVVENARGGFCYELNSIFYGLLKDIGFTTHMISSRTFDKSGILGPEFDHMSLYVKMDKEYIADVGFGDLFLRPLEIKGGMQNDGRNFFLIEEDNAGGYILSMSSDASDFQKKYTFTLKDAALDSFKEPCLDKQTNPESYFVKNTVCTKPTESGRITLFNNRIINKRGEERTETPILSDMDLRVQLIKHFEIQVP